MGLRKRAEGVHLGELQVEVERETAFAKQYPCLVDFIMMTAWPEDGSERKTGSLLVFVQDGHVKVRLVDNDADQVAFWAAGTLTGALQVVEEALESGTGDWRAQRPFPGPKKK